MVPQHRPKGPLWGDKRGQQTGECYHSTPGTQRQVPISQPLTLEPVPPTQQWGGRGQGMDTAAEQMAKFLDSHMCTHVYIRVYICIFN